MSRRRKQVAWLVVGYLERKRWVHGFATLRGAEKYSIAFNPPARIVRVTYPPKGKRGAPPSIGPRRHAKCSGRGGYGPQGGSVSREPHATRAAQLAEAYMSILAPIVRMCPGCSKGFRSALADEALAEHMKECEGWRKHQAAVFGIGRAER